METIQFRQEQMLPELKEFVERGIFTQQETKDIVRKRTAFESMLARYSPKKEDFLRYAAYEMALEALRKKRVKRLKIPKMPHSLTDHALVQRQYNIFERALVKFKVDIGIWIQYAELARKERARSLVGRILGRAIQIHPNEPSLYILAASHELKSHLSMNGARTMLLRGIRLNPENLQLWTEYVKCELGFAEELRRTSSLLKELDGEEGEEGGDVSMEVEANTAREDILNGAIVKTVVNNAVKAVPTIEAFKSLLDIIRNYPCPLSLRQHLQEHLHELLCSTCPIEHNPSAAKLYATRKLVGANAENEDFVDVLKESNEALIKILTGSGFSEGMQEMYAEFVREFFEKEIDDYLRLYLLSALHSLCSSTTGVLLSAHLHLLTSPKHPTPQPPKTKVLDLARKYSTWTPKSSGVWIARLELEPEWKTAWATARAVVETEEVWLWGLERLAEDVEEYDKLIAEARSRGLLDVAERLAHALGNLRDNDRGRE